MTCCDVGLLKDVKLSQTRGKPVGFCEYTQTKQLVIYVVSDSFYFINFFKFSATEVCFSSRMSYLIGISSSINFDKSCFSLSIK